MALLEIIPDTNPLMRKTCKRVQRVDDKMRKLVDDMYETMVDGWGIGLAAIQVSVRKRFFIYEIPKRPVKGYETCPPDLDDVDEDNPDRTEDQVEPEEVDDAQDEEESEAGYTGDFTVCINPRITAREGKIIEEECLSRPGWVAKVERDYRITFQAYDLDMQKFERTVQGLEARCVQHETDHLDGILFTDRCIAGSLREVTSVELLEEEEIEPTDELEIDDEEEHAIELEDSSVAGD